MQTLELADHLQQIGIALETMPKTLRGMDTVQGSHASDAGQRAEALSDVEFAAVAACLPADRDNAQTRSFIEAVLTKINHGVPWTTLSHPDMTRKRFERWSLAGRWQDLHRAAQVHLTVERADQFARVALVAERQRCRILASR